MEGSLLEACGAWLYIRKLKELLVGRLRSAGREWDPAPTACSPLFYTMAPKVKAKAKSTGKAKALAVAKAKAWARAQALAVPSLVQPLVPPPRRTLQAALFAALGVGTPRAKAKGMHRMQQWRFLAPRGRVALGAGAPRAPPAPAQVGGALLIPGLTGPPPPLRGVAPPGGAGLGSAVAMAPLGAAAAGDLLDAEAPPVGGGALAAAARAPLFGRCGAPFGSGAPPGAAAGSGAGHRDGPWIHGPNLPEEVRHLSLPPGAVIEMSTLDANHATDGTALWRVDAGYAPDIGGYFFKGSFCGASSPARAAEMDRIADPPGGLPLLVHLCTTRRENCRAAVQGFRVLHTDVFRTRAAFTLSELWARQRVLCARAAPAPLAAGSLMAAALPGTVPGSSTKLI